MKRIFSKTIILGLMVLLIFNIASPVHANQIEKGSSPNMEHLDKNEQKIIKKHLKSLKAENAKNSKKLSKENKKIANESLDNSESNLVYADIAEGEKNIILNTDDPKTFVAVTDENIEVVEQVGDSEFLMNGELHQFEVTIINDVSEPLTSLASGFEGENSGEISTQATTAWTFIGSTWINVNAARDFHTYSASGLGSVLAGIIATVGGVGFWGVTVASLGVGMAYNYIASSEYPTNTGRSHVYRYKRGVSPLTDYRTKSYDYAVYYGKSIYLGVSERIRKSCVGCGV